MKNQPIKFNKYLYLAVMGVILVIAVAMILVNPTPGKETPAESSAPTAASEAEAVSVPVEPDFPPIDLGQGLRITDIGAYTGAYVEDGTNDVVSDVLMVILENTSEKALQYAQVTLQFGQETARFDLTNLPAGQKAVLLEQERMAFSSQEPDGWLLENPVFLEEFPMYEDVFQIIAEENVLTLRNISDTPVSGDVYVYYKNWSQGLYYGGITFRAKIEGGLEPQEQKQVMASHFNPAASAILMVTYAP